MSDLLLTSLAVLLLLVIAADSSWCDRQADPIPIDLHLAFLAGAFVLYAVMIAFVMRRRARGHLGWMLVGLVVVLRLVVLAGPHRYNSDVWRYVWDGHVLASGLNPYAHAPADPALESMRDPAIYGRLNPAFNEIHTVYGPVATVCFAVCARLPFDPAASIRVLMTLGDLLTFLLVGLLLARRGLPRWGALVYGLNPLLLDAFAQRGQVEGILLPLLIVSVLLLEQRRYAWAGLALAAATLVKVMPLVLFPLLLRCAWNHGRDRAMRFGLACTLALIVGGLPCLLAGRAAFSGLTTYAARWRANESLFGLAEALVNTNGARVIAGLAVAIAVLCSMRRATEPRIEHLAIRIVVVLTTVLLFAPAVFPWYVTWLLPFAPFAWASKRRRWYGIAAICWSATVLLWYLRFLNDASMHEPYWPALAAIVRESQATLREPWRLAEYAPVLGLISLAWLPPRRRHAPTEERNPCPEDASAT